jgi:hypothetical protein
VCGPPITQPSITLHYLMLYYITFHYITLHYITLQYITLHYITLDQIARVCVVCSPALLVCVLASILSCGVAGVPPPWWCVCSPPAYQVGRVIRRSLKMLRDIIVHRTTLNDITVHLTLHYIILH